MKHKRWILGGLVFLLAGCVQRHLVIETESAGARVYLDSIAMGYTPLTVQFSHYGTRKIVLEKGGYVKETRIMTLESPWYEAPFIDFFAEVLWPKTLIDTHHVQVTLAPLVFEDKGFKDRALEARQELEGVSP